MVCGDATEILTTLLRLLVLLLEHIYTELCSLKRIKIFILVIILIYLYWSILMLFTWKTSFWTTKEIWRIHFIVLIRIFCCWSLDVINTFESTGFSMFFSLITAVLIPSTSFYSLLKMRSYNITILLLALTYLENSS